jgi:Poxvirus Late Transcription Factor VLTF3 like
MKPTRYENNIPVFTTRDIDDYGFPENYGFDNYIVVESRELNLVSDYKQEHEYDLRPIHRYSRLARFKSTLYQLIGERGSVPSAVITMVKAYLKPDSKDKWNATRSILKHYKQTAYYNRIPLILVTLGYQKSVPSTTGSQLSLIINDFMRISEKFERIKHTFKLRYFPNIRFIVLKLLQKHGIETNYPVPFIRTERKRKSLEELWLQL